MPKITVVIPCYNHGQSLPETLASVEAQSCEDYEIIIVNDGSTDAATLELLHALDESKVKIIHTENLGVSAARNRAIREACGTYILPLDADDMIAPTYLEKALAILEERPEVSIVYCDQRLFGGRNEILMLPDYEPRRILVQNLISVSAVFRREDWLSVGGYCEAMRSGWEDWEFWVAMSRMGRPVVKIDEPLFLYRVSSSSRDNTLNFSKKLVMYGLIVWRHRMLYLSNAGYVLRSLCGHFLSGGHR